MKAKYIKWHNNYPFELGQIYDAQPHDSEWIRIESDNQLYRKECFEFVGVLKNLIDFIDDFGIAPRVISGVQREAICTELSELERLAEIGKLVEAWNADPKHQVIFVTKVGEHGQMYSPLDKAMERFKEERGKCDEKI